MSMGLFTLKMAKKAFFDRPIVMRQVRKERRARLAKFGGFTMVTARRSIRKRQSYSMPGSQPHSHVGWLRKFILFAYDAGRDSEVIGATLLPRKRTGPDNRGLLGETIPQLLEYGGHAQRRARVVSRSEPRVFPTKRRVVTYEARPYMHPAFAVAMKPENLSRIWRDAIRAST